MDAHLLSVELLRRNTRLYTFVCLFVRLKCTSFAGVIHRYYVGVIRRYAPAFFTNTYNCSTLRIVLLDACFRICRTPVHVYLRRPFVHLSDARTRIRAYGRWVETLL